MAARYCYVSDDSGLTLVQDTLTGEWLLPLTTVARIVGFSRHAVHNWWRRGHIPHGIINGRFHYFQREDLQEIIDYAKFCQRVKTSRQSAIRRRKELVHECV